MALAIITQSAWILRKTTRTENKLYAIMRELSETSHYNFRQQEDLLALYQQLSPRRALPRTRGWAASPDFLRIVMEQIHERRPKVIFELGSGASTIVAAYALERLGSGQIYSLDHNEHYLKDTSSRIQNHGLSDFVTLIHAPLVESSVGNQLWYDLSHIQVTAIDMLVIDGPPSSTAPMARYPAVPLLFDRLGADARLVLDDSARSDEKACVARWLAEHPELTAQEIACEKGCTILTLNRRGH